MNRERLTILRDHLAGLPDASFSMMTWPQRSKHQCNSAVCVGGWADRIFDLPGISDTETYKSLGLNEDQGSALCFPNLETDYDDVKPSDAVAAIQSMLDNPDEGALPVWPVE